MAGTFNPTIASDIGYRQPIVTQQGFSPTATVFDIANDALSAYAKGQTEEKPLAGKDRESAALRPFVQELEDTMAITDSRVREIKLQRIRQKAYTTIPEYRSEFDSLWEGISGIAVPEAAVTPQDSLILGRNKWLQESPEGRVAAAASTRFDANGEMDPVATETALNTMYFAYEQERAMLEGIKRKNEIGQASVESTALEVENKFLPIFQNKVLATAEGLASRLPLAAKNGATVSEALVDVQMSIDRLTAEYSANLVSVGLNPTDARFKPDRVLLPLMGLKNTLEALQKYPELKLKEINSVAGVNLAGVMGQAGVPPTEPTMNAMAMYLAAGQAGQVLSSIDQTKILQNPWGAQLSKVWNSTQSTTISGEPTGTPQLYDPEVVRQQFGPEVPAQTKVDSIESSAASLKALTPQFIEVELEGATALAVSHFAPLAEGVAKTGPMSPQELNAIFDPKIMTNLRLFPNGSENQKVVVGTAVAALERELSKNIIFLERFASKYEMAYSFNNGVVKFEGNSEEWNRKITPPSVLENTFESVTGIQVPRATDGVFAAGTNSPALVKQNTDAVTILYNRYVDIMGPTKANELFSQLNYQPGETYTWDGNSLVGGP